MDIAAFLVLCRDAETSLDYTDTLEIISLYYTDAKQLQFNGKKTKMRGAGILKIWIRKK